MTTQTPQKQAQQRRLERTRSRFAHRQWRRRFTAWRGMLVGVLVVALLVFMAWLFYGSSAFALRTVAVSGLGEGALVTPQQIVQSAGFRAGVPLLRQDLSAAHRRIEALAEVKAVTVVRQWPHGVTISVTPRTPIAVAEIGQSLHALDLNGVVFGTYAQAPKGLPVVQTPANTSTLALHEAAEIAAAMPASLATQVDHITVQTIDQIALTMRDGRTVAWGSSQDTALKVQVLTALIKAVPQAHAFDVSVPGQPVAQ